MRKLLVHARTTAAQRTLRRNRRTRFVPLLLFALPGCTPSAIGLMVVDGLTPMECFGTRDNPLNIPHNDDIREVADAFCQGRGFSAAASVDGDEKKLTTICCAE